MVKCNRGQRFMRVICVLEGESGELGRLWRRRNTLQFISMCLRERGRLVVPVVRLIVGAMGKISCYQGEPFALYRFETS